MADETYILKFEVESGDAISEQERLKAAIINLKQEASNLQKAYKQGSITLQEYASESTRVENNQKKLVAAYSNVQRSVTGLKNPIKELTESNEKLAKQSEKTAEQFAQLGEKIELGGTSLTGLTSKMAQFATPVGAAIGLVSALGAAYAQSTVGAKDLEFAENELAAAFQLTSDRFAALVSNGEEGQGFFSKLTAYTVGAVTSLGNIGTAASNAAEVAGAAFNIEKLQEFERELSKLRAIGNDRLQDNQDLLTKINDSQTSYNDKVKLFAQIQGNLDKNREEQLANLSGQIQLLEDQRSVTKDKEGLEQLINDKLLERSQLEKGINRLQESNNRLASNTADAAQRELKAKQDQVALDKEHAQFQSEDDADKRFAKNRAQVQTNLDLTNQSKIAIEDESKAILANSQAQINRAEANDEVNFGLVTQNGLTQEQITNLLVLSNTLNMAQSLFKKNSIAFKATASSKAVIDTYLGASEALTLGPPLGPILAAITIATGLANVAKINGANFADGGFVSGPGSGTSDSIPARLSNGEYVVNAKSTSEHLPLLESINSRFSSGGQVVTQAQTAKLPSFSFEEMIKKMPQPVLGFKEFTEFQQRLDFKESITKA